MTLKAVNGIDWNSSVSEVGREFHTVSAARQKARMTKTVLAPASRREQSHLLDRSSQLLCAGQFSSLMYIDNYVAIAF